MDKNNEIKNETLILDEDNSYDDLKLKKLESAILNYTDGDGVDPFFENDKRHAL